MAGRDDDVMEDAEPESRTQRLRSTVTAVQQVKKQKGRGFREQGGDSDRYDNSNFESLEPVSTGPAKSVEGYVVFVTGVHEEAQEEDIHEAFAEYGDIKNIYLNLDRQTGFVKGYALVEYGTKAEAQAAIQALDDAELLTQKIKVTWAFSRGPIKPTGRANRGRR